MVEAELAGEYLVELHGRLGSCFSRVEPFRQAAKYITGLMSDLPRKNAWTIAEHAGDPTPDRMQRLLNHAVWDTYAVMAQMRRFVVEHLAPADQTGLAVAALDETGQPAGSVRSPCEPKGVLSIPRCQDSGSVSSVWDVLSAWWRVRK